MRKKTFEFTVNGKIIDTEPDDIMKQINDIETEIKDEIREGMRYVPGLDIALFEGVTRIDDMGDHVKYIVGNRLITGCCEVHCTATSAINIQKLRTLKMLRDIKGFRNR